MSDELTYAGTANPYMPSNDALIYARVQAIALQLDALEQRFAELLAIQERVAAMLEREGLMAYPHEIPWKCYVCGGELKKHERNEGFCDKCLRAAQQAPYLTADLRAKVKGY